MSDGPETRSQATKKRKLEPMKSSTVGHLATDASGTFRKAVDQGDSLDETFKGKMKGDVHRDKLIAPGLDRILRKDLATRIVEHQKSGNVVSQVDNRMDARRGRQYKGYLFSPTRVSSDTFESGRKEINESLSPNPYGRKLPGDEEVRDCLLRAFDGASSDRGGGLKSALPACLLASAIDLLQAQFELGIGRDEMSARGSDA